MGCEAKKKSFIEKVKIFNNTSNSLFHADKTPTKRTKFCFPSTVNCFQRIIIDLAKAEGGIFDQPKKSARAFGISIQSTLDRGLKSH